MNESSGALNRIKDVVLDAFDRLSPEEAVRLCKDVREESFRRGFTYQRGPGNLETINIMLLPAFLTEERSSYVHGLSIAIKRGIDAVARAYFKDPALSSALPFREDELRWINYCSDASTGPVPLWYRLDAHLHMKEEDWRERISVFEINSCAVGGIHYSPTAEEIFLDVIHPFLMDHLKGVPPFGKTPDLRDMLIGMLRSHAASIGRRTFNVAFVEDTTLEEGITEMPFVVEYCKSRGVNAHYADPRELRVEGEEVLLGTTPIDVVYRNFELSDIIEMERSGSDVSAMRHAFSRNMIVSSVFGDFDHKSMWEVLASGAFDRYFSPMDAKLFKKHLLWTRVVGERKTTGPEGLSIDLMPYAVKNKDTLVLKPNRLCGGYGVTLGPLTPRGEWEAAIDNALKDGGNWVLQSYNSPETSVFPVCGREGFEYFSHNIVYGISTTPEGTGILGRVSRQGVVNVAQQGGLMPVLRSY